MNTTQKTNTMKIWVGCLASYNEGHLHGKWYDLDDFSEIEELESAMQEDIIKTSPAHYPEELWVMDHENFPEGFGECSPWEAWKIHEFLNQFDNLEAAKVLFSYETIDIDNESDVDFFNARMESYFGYFPDPREYAYAIADAGYLEIPNELNGFIDWEAVAHNFSIETHFETKGHYFGRL